MSETAIELKNITKIFPGVIALDNMSLSVQKGDIHGVIGENGAGKSTLMKVLTGVHIPDNGEIVVFGEKVKFKNTEDARKRGIACVYQELNIVPESSVTDNIFIGNYIHKGKFSIDSKKMRNIASDLMHSLGLDINVDVPCGTLGIGQQQMIEIAKAIQLNAKIIILDEPTASLGEKEVELLFKTVRRLKDQGITFLFISHKLEEIFELCDKVTVMRDSKHIITTESCNLTKDSLISYMVGRTLNNLYPKVKSNRGDEALRTEKLTRMGEFYDIDFAAYRGELLGISGLVGSGRTELFQSIFGLSQPDGGKIFINGREVNNTTPNKAIANKMAFLTEDRKHQGLILDFSVEENLNIISLNQKGRKFIINSSKRKASAKSAISKLKIKVSDSSQTASQLSGGNQQKVVIGKWLESDADIYIFDEPTKGIDIGAKIEVYHIMDELVQEGKCVIMISSELTEILGMSDRVIIMREGEIMGEVMRGSDEFNQEDIMKYAWGRKAV